MHRAGLHIQRSPWFLTDKSGQFTLNYVSPGVARGVARKVHSQLGLVAFGSTQGFIDASRAKRAGKVNRPRARMTVRFPSSSGCRRASSASR